MGIKMANNAQNILKLKEDSSDLFWYVDTVA